MAFGGMSEGLTSDDKSNVFAGPVCRLVPRLNTQYSIVVYRRPEAARQVASGYCMWLTVPDKAVKFRDPRLNRS